MPLPLAVTALAPIVLNKLFGNNIGYSLPPSPEFFGPKFNQYVAAGRQRAQSQYGGVETDIRNMLANNGQLQSGALPDALTKAAISKGQDVSNFETGANQNEYNAQQAFATGPGYSAELGKSGVDYTHALDQRTSQMDSLNKIFSLLGSGLVKDKTAPVPVGATDTTGITNPGFGPQNPSHVHDILKLLFGL